MSNGISMFFRIASTLFFMVLGVFTSSASEPPLRAMWVYETAELQSSEKAQEELFGFCRERHITDLFWQMHFKRERERGAQEILDAVSLRGFLKKATAQGLRIHALAGDPSHVLTENHDRVLTRVESLLAFNKASDSDSRFAGLHLDIEPHAMTEWRKADTARKCALLTQLVELNAKVVERLHAEPSPLIYGVDIAFWLDKTDKDGAPLLPVTFRGVTQDTTKHLLAMADNVALMSYRGTAEGKNGINSIVAHAISSADATKGRILVGVKMADIGPKLESFFGKSEDEMNAELAKVDAAFKDHRGYAGLAFFMYSAFKSMPHHAP